ncbi:MAG: SIS domain-containing protein [Anaerolineaceae bacterium]
MASDFNRKEYLDSLTQALEEKDKAGKLGIELAKNGIKNIFLVGCGAPNREMGAIKYFLDRDSKKLETYLYYPAEFINLVPAKLGPDSLVVLATHSGTTPEMIQAADFVKKFKCKTVGITQFADSPLAKNVQYPLAYGQSDHGYSAKFMIILALLASIMQEMEGWKLADKIMKSLDALPGALADTAEASDQRGAEEARLYKDDDFMMIMGSGPNYSTAYAFGICVLMEMQWMHTHVGEAAEFFHGPFEVLDQNTPVFLFKGEDASRPLVERVERFCKKYTERLVIYDSKDYEMRGIDPDVRAIVAPMILSSATDRFSQHLSVWHNHPLSTRRYMWKFDY